MNKKHVVILYSGGLDSFSMYQMAIRTNIDILDLVYFDIGHDYAWKEIESMHKMGMTQVKVHKIDWSPNTVEKDGSDSGSIIIPGRNAVFAQLAASIYQPDEIWMGALKGEDHAGSTDKNQVFLDVMNAQLGYVHSPFAKVPRVKFPFIEKGWSKLDMVRTMLNGYGISAEVLMQTSSCLSGDTELPCGRCVVCARMNGSHLKHLSCRICIWKCTALICMMNPDIMIIIESKKSCRHSLSI